MTKTEQALLDRIRALNDKQEGADAFRIIEKTKVTRSSWRSPPRGGDPKKNELSALESIVSKGAVEIWNGRYYIKDHPALGVAASKVDLSHWENRVEVKRKELAQVEEMYAKHLAFVERWKGK